MLFRKRRQEEGGREMESRLYEFNDIRRNIAENILTRQDRESLIQQLQCSINWLEENTCKLTRPLFNDEETHMVIPIEQTEKISEIINKLCDLRNEIVNLVECGESIDRSMADEIADVIDDLLDREHRLYR